MSYSTILFLGTIGLLAILPKGQAAGGPAWGFMSAPSGVLKPADWGNGTGYEDCDGSRQSPINIVTEDVEYKDTLAEFSLTGYDEAGSGMLEVKNTGHGLQVSLPSGQSASISGGGLPAGDWTFLQFHIHVGDSATVGSEHSIDGTFYPGELHIVHQKGDEYAPLGMMLEVADTGSPLFDNILSEMANVSYKGDKVHVPNMKLKDILPSDLTGYYRYDGSVTTPPCPETAIWTLFHDAIPITTAQLDMLRGIFKNEEGDGADRLTNDNYRPVQDLNGRKVYTSKDDDAAGAAPGGPHSFPFMLMTVSVLLISLIC